MFNYLSFIKRSVVLLALLSAQIAHSDTQIKDPTKPWRDPAADIASFEDLLELPSLGQSGAPSSSSAPLSTPGMLSLTGIKYRKQAKSRGAIINGEMLSIGDRVAGSTIKDIQKNHITVLQNGQRIKVKLFDTSVKKSK